MSDDQNQADTSGLPPGKTTRVDLNTASVEELINLPGIGQALAERIIAARPYQSIEDLTEVQGINTVLLDGFKDQVTVSGSAAVPEALLDEEAGEDAGMENGESLPASAGTEDAPPAGEQPQEKSEPTGDQPEETSSEGQLPQDMPVETYPAEMFAAQEIGPQEASSPVLADEAAPESGVHESPQETTAPLPVAPQPQAASQPPTPRGISVVEVLLIAAGSNLITLILAIFITLGILAAINGDVRYVLPANLAQVQRQLDSVNSQTSALQNDLQGLRTRMDNLEALSGRVSTVEKATQNLQSEVQAAQSQLDAVDQKLSGLASQVETVQSDVQQLQQDATRFNTFLDGLVQLLGNLQAPQNGGGTAPGGK